MRAFLALELYDKNRDLLFKQKKPVRSFLYNWTKVIYGLSYTYANSGAATLKDTDGTDRAYPNLYGVDKPLFRFRADEGDVTYGILVGNGTTAVTLDDYNLASKIAHGTGAGQLHYYETNTRHYTDSDRSYLEVSRRFYNESGGDITVSEVGLGFREIDASGPAFHFLILRDLVDPAVTLDDYNLASKIAHGTGAGQLHYYETNTRHYTDSDRSYLEVSRRFYNESGGDITVSEVGLVFSEQDASNVKYFFLILRDLLDPAVTVANYQTLIVKYIFEFLL